MTSRTSTLLPKTADPKRCPPAESPAHQPAWDPATPAHALEPAEPPAARPCGGLLPEPAWRPGPTRCFASVAVAPILFQPTRRSPVPSDHGKPRMRVAATQRGQCGAGAAPRRILFRHRRLLLGPEAGSGRPATWWSRGGRGVMLVATTRHPASGTPCVQQNNQTQHKCRGYSSAGRT